MLDLSGLEHRFNVDAKVTAGAGTVGAPESLAEFLVKAELLAVAFLQLKLNHME